MHYLFLTVVALIRLVPHPWNLTPIGAVGLYAGARCDPRVAWLMPLIPLLIGDLVTGLYDPLIMVFVYLGFGLSAVVGRWLLAASPGVARYVAAVGFNGVIFYVLSNFPVWLVYYPDTVAGLLDCYLKGLPYLGRALIGDALFVTLIFGIDHLAHRYLAAGRTDVKA